MPEQSLHLANKYEDIVNLQGVGDWECGGFQHSLLVTNSLNSSLTYRHSTLYVTTEWHVWHELHLSDFRMLSATFTRATMALSRVVFWDIQCRKMSWPWNWVASPVSQSRASRPSRVAASCSSKKWTKVTAY